MTEEEILDDTRRYIAENFLYARPGYVLDEDDHLMERGIIDSMGMLELIGHFEERFGVHALDEEITEQNLSTLRRIAAFVAHKQALAAQVQ
jgi:acyl carrier protein